MPEFRNMIIKNHIQRMSDPVYKAGFESENNKDNPYVLDVKLNLEIVKIANKSGPLTDEEKKYLKELTNQLNQTEYIRWSTGYYIKECYPFLKELTQAA